MESMQDIQKRAHPSTIQIFKKDDVYTINQPNNDLNTFINQHTLPFKLTQTTYESCISFILHTLRLNIEEYECTANNLYSLIKKATPTLFNDYHDILFNNGIRVISSFCPGTNIKNSTKTTENHDLNAEKCSFAFYDTIRNIIFCCDFYDDDILSNLCSILVEINCNEIVYNDVKIERSLLNLGLSIQYFNKKNKCLSNENKAVDLLKNYLNCDVGDLEEYKCDNIEFLNEINCKRNSRVRLFKYETGGFMKMDVKTLDLLNITGKSGFIEKYLKTSTQQGNRLLNKIIRQPLKDKNMIEDRLIMVDYLNFCSNHCGFNISVVLSKFYDLVKYSKRIMKLKVNEIINIYYVLKNIEKIVYILNACIKKYEEKIYKSDNEYNFERFLTILNNEYLYPLLNLNENFKNLLPEIEKTIDIDTSTLKFDLSDELNDQKEETEQEIKSEYERVQSINKKAKIECKDNLYSFKLPRSEYKNFKENKFVEKSVLKSGIVFTTSTLEKCNHDLEKINAKIRDETRIVMDNLLFYVNNYSSQFDVLNYVVAKIDVFYTFSKLSNLGFTRPKFIDENVGFNQEDREKMNLNINNHKKFDSNNVNVDLTINDHLNGKECEKNILCKNYTENADLNEIEINNKISFHMEEGFHPLIKECIKNSITLKNKRFCTVTGPNMGGKSTFLKTISTISILAQTGCLVPCKTSFIPIIDGIFLRIGNNDNASKGMSTFMVEMNDIARICRNATKKSLVVIDELGRGTSAIDGLSLALSVKDYLVEKNCITLFATHFSEICLEENGLESNNGKGNGVVHKRVKILNDNELTLLYEIEDGYCDTSLGVEVAKRVGFPDEIVEFSKRILDGKEN